MWTQKSRQEREEGNQLSQKLQRIQVRRMGGMSLGGITNMECVRSLMTSNEDTKLSNRFGRQWEEGTGVDELVQEA